MNKNLIYGIVGALALVVVGYVLMNTGNKPTETVVTETVSSPAPISEVIVSLAQQNDSGESGGAILREVDGKVMVALSMTTGAPAGVPQPAHIHVGACPNVGAVKYPLLPPVNGESVTTLDVTLAQLKSELPLGINVHKSQTEAGIYVSCGNLAL